MGSRFLNRQAFGGGQLAPGSTPTPPPAPSPTMSLSSAVTQAEGNTGTAAFVWTLTLNRNGSTAAVPYNWAVTGNGASPADAADFGGTLPTGSGTFAAGETSKTITVLVAGDTAVEPNETFLLTVSAAGLASVTSTGTISNDDSAAPSYSMRFVSNNSAVPYKFTAANTMWNCREFHYFKEVIPGVAAGPRPIIPNFWVGSTDLDTALAGNTTVEMSIEYPIGSARQRLLFGGQNTYVGTALYIIPDVYALSTTPVVGDRYLIHFQWSNPNGIIYTDLGAAKAYLATGYDGYELGTALTNKVMSGTVPNAVGAGNSMLKTMGVIDNGTMDAWAIGLDSRSYGQAGTANASGDTGELAPSIGVKYGYFNYGIPGHRVDSFVAAGTSQVRPTLINLYATKVASQGAINDLITTPQKTAAQVIASKISERNMFPGKPYYASTVPTGNQVNDAARISYNASILGGAITGCSAVADVAGVLMVQPDAGSWNAGYDSGDHIHEAAAGYAAIKTSGPVTTAFGL